MISMFTRLDSWYFIMALAFRHLLLTRLCLPDTCHLIDVLFYNGRSSFSIIAHLLLFLITLIFLCIWLGLTLYVTDSSDTPSPWARLAPSRYVYFVYHVLLNVGYGDTTEQSLLSFLTIIGMTLLACPLLIIIHQNFIHDLNRIKTKSIHVETMHGTSFVNSLIGQIRKHRQLNGSSTSEKGHRSMRE